MATAFISLGSNIDAELNIQRALGLLSEWSRLTGLSRFYQTAAIGTAPQPDFLNGVARIETDLKPHPLKFEMLRNFEAAIGRVRGEDKFAARTIDLDILLYGDESVDSPDLKLPDPDLFERDFLAACILDIDAAVSLPDGRLVASLFPAEAVDALVCNNDFSRQMKSRFLK